MKSPSWKADRQNNIYEVDMYNPLVIWIKIWNIVIYCIWRYHITQGLLIYLLTLSCCCCCFLFRAAFHVFPMLAVKELAAHNIKGYSCKLYFLNSDLFGLLPVKSVVPFPVIYRQPATKTLKDLLVTHSLRCGNILLKEMISFILNAHILIYKKR